METSPGGETFVILAAMTGLVIEGEPEITDVVLTLDHYAANVTAPGSNSTLFALH